MALIFYSSKKNINDKRLLKTIESERINKDIEIFKTVEDLSKRIRQPDCGNKILVLFIEDMAEFYQIFTIKKSLSDVRIILILPDRTEEIISAGYKLHPRFISYMDSDFKDVAVVLNRMVKIAGENNASGY